MAQLNITLNQDEILQLLSADREDAFRTLLQESLISVLTAESQEQLQAKPDCRMTHPVFFRYFFQRSRSENKFSHKLQHRQF